MTKVKKLEHDVRELSAKELADFRKWFVEYDALAWDAEIAADVANGRLNGLADQALADHTAGRSRKL